MQDDGQNGSAAASFRRAVAEAAAPAAPSRGPNKLIALAGAAMAVAIAGGVGVMWETAKPPVPIVPPAPPIPIQQPALPLRSEAAILDEDVSQLTPAWFAPNPNILVLDFPDLTSQGQAFNRMAAFIEKRGQSHDRVLDDAELAEAIRSDNSTVETYYYGHDYRAADIQRFYAAIDLQKLRLSKIELDLKSLLSQAGFLDINSKKAVISIPRKGSDPFVDASGRESLLRHELSHGEYFTNPAFASYVRRFWATRMSDIDRGTFRGFLSRQGYDPANEDLMANETQAHLMNTTDRRYFNAAACGLPVSRLAALRQQFLAEMPEGWLRDAMTSMKPRLPS